MAVHWGGRGRGHSSRWTAAASGGTPTPTPAPGASAITFPTAETVGYHVNSQFGSMTIDGSDRLTNLPDLKGLAALAAVAGVTAPKVMTDDMGRKFLRFNGNEAAAIANALVINNRAFTAIMVGRVPHSRNSIAFLNPRFSAYTSAGVNTAANGSIGYMRATVSSSSAPFLQGGLPSASSNATDCYKAIPGCQMQVIGVSSRTTANGGTRLYINNDVCDVAQQSTSVTGYIGGIVGGSAGASNTENITGSVNNVFDCYALSVWQGELSNAQADACIAAAVTHYDIAQLDANLVLEGDSIMDGIATNLGTSPAWSGGIGTHLTNPGSELVAPNVRVLNNGSSGNQTSHLVTKRDATNSIYDKGKYPGGAAKNRVAVQIGRNDFSQTGGQKNSAMLYADIVALLNTTTTGYLQRGWSVTQAANIAAAGTAVSTNVSPAGENTIHKRIEGLRDLIADTGAHTPQSQFLTDTLSNTGQTYEGLVDVLHLYDISFASGLPFKTVISAGIVYPTGLYDDDLTHLPAEGIAVMASGGDTPQYGYGALA